MDRWEPGSFIDGSAFEGYVLGRPKIDRVRMLFKGDPNVVVVSLLSEDVQVAADLSLSYEQGVILEREWATRSGGTVLYGPTQLREAEIQFRPELVNPSRYPPSPEPAPTVTTSATLRIRFKLASLPLITPMPVSTRNVRASEAAKGCLNREKEIGDQRQDRGNDVGGSHCQGFGNPRRLWIEGNPELLFDHGFGIGVRIASKRP